MNYHARLITEQNHQILKLKKELAEKRNYINQLNVNNKMLAAELEQHEMMINQHRPQVVVDCWRDLIHDFDHVDDFTLVKKDGKCYFATLEETS